MTYPEPQPPMVPPAPTAPQSSHLPVSAQRPEYAPPQQYVPGASQPPQPMYAPQPQMVVTAPKSAGIAILLSLLWFGAGHLYANQIGLGIGLVVYGALLAVLSATVVGLIVSIPLWLISLPVVLYLASRAADDYNRRNELVVR